MNSLIAVGSIAYDTLETPFGRRDRALGGSAVHFALAANLFTDVGVVSWSKIKNSWSAPGFFYFVFFF